MTSRTPTTCQHELRPGTKVCLHCRRAEREAKAARQRAILVRVGMTAAAVGACAYAGLAGFRAWQGQGSPTLAAFLAAPASLEAAPVRATTVSVPIVPSAAVPAATEPTTPATGEQVPEATPIAAPGTAVPSAPLAPAESVAPAQSAPLVGAPAAPVVVPPPPVPSLHPVVAEGRTELQAGIYAMRRGDTVTVHFDTPEARTRRPEKFEQIVRATLPAVHGSTAELILSSIAAGDLVGPGDAITEPRSRGIALRAGDGVVLSVLPQTRPGRDGPLVVAYRVIPAR